MTTISLTYHCTSTFYLITGVQQSVQQLWLAPLMGELNTNRKRLAKNILGVLNWTAEMEFFQDMGEYYEYECRK